jgi:cytochrome c-type biogenesis protein CcmH
LIWPSTSFAWEPNEVLPDAALEQRARDISAQLRCLVCQNQSIDDSDAGLAKDLRLLVRERLSAGDTNDEVFLFLVARYGEFILLKPRFGFSTALLWGLPLLLLVAGGLIIVRSLQRPKARTITKDLNQEEKLRLAKIVNEQ